MQVKCEFLSSRGGADDTSVFRWDIAPRHWVISNPRFERQRNGLIFNGRMFSEEFCITHSILPIMQQSDAMSQENGDLEVKS
jgi:hypothetical protein